MLLRSPCRLRPGAASLAPSAARAARPAGFAEAAQKLHHAGRHRATTLRTRLGRRARLGVRAASADEQKPPPTTLGAKLVEVSAELERLGVKQSRQRLIVAGPNSDLAAVKLFQQALAGEPLPDESDDPAAARKLRAMFEQLDELADRTADEMGDVERVSSPLTDSSDLSEQEKRQVGAAFAGVAYWGVQAALWSSFIMVGLFVAASRLGGG